jgi:uncharacterized protein (DUF58 family)
LSLRLTPEGMSLMVLEAVVFFAAFSTGANLVYVVGSMILGLFIVSFILRLRGVGDLGVHLQLPQEAHEETPFPYQIHLANPSSRNHYLLRVAARFGQGLPPLSVPLMELRAGESTVLRGDLSLPMRGAYSLEGVGVASVYPAGLISSENLLPASGEVVVLPAPLKHPFPVIPGFNQRASWTETGSNFRGEGTSFYGLREYQPGDPIRKIHWKATARQGRPMLVEEEEDRVNRYYVFLDLHRTKLNGSGRTSNLEVSIRVGATLTLQLLKLNCPVRVFLMDENLSASPESFSAADIPRAQRFLGRLRYTPEGDFPGSISRLLPAIPPGSFMLFVLPDAEPKVLELLNNLRYAPYSLFCLFNVSDAAAARATAAVPAVRQLMRSGVYTLFFDGTEERVITL